MLIHGILHGILETQNFRLLFFMSNRTVKNKVSSKTLFHSVYFVLCIDSKYDICLGTTQVSFHSRH